MSEVSLSGVREAMAEVAGRFDPALVSVELAERAVADGAAIEHLAATVKALAAARVASTERWRRADDASPEEWLARTTGASKGHAKTALRTGKRLRSLPETGAAARRGGLSPTQAAEIADAAAVDPDSEGRLVKMVEDKSSVGELRDACRRTRAAADPNPEATAARIRRARHLREFTDSEGAYNLQLRNTNEVGAMVRAALQPLTDQIFADARKAGRREPAEAYAADAFTELCRRSLAGARPGARPGGTRPAEAPEATMLDQASAPAAAGDGTPSPAASGAATAADAAAAVETDGGGTTEVGADSGPVTKTPPYLGILRLDVEALRRGRTEGDEVVEIAGVGPIPVSTAEELLGDAVLKLVITKGVDVLNVTHLGRAPTVAQKIAMLWEAPSCEVKGCNRLRRLQADHRVTWSSDQRTELANLDHLCKPHHDLKTHKGWALVEGTGKRPMVPPDDPRHPDTAATRHGTRPPPDPVAEPPPEADRAQHPTLDLGNTDAA